MSLIDVRSYFRTRMDSAGFTEWRDGFNFENLPSSILDRSYHIESGSIEATASNHQVHEFNCPVTLRLFLKGYLDPVQAIDDAYTDVESILSAILPPDERFGTAVLDVVPGSITIVPLADSNDNSLIVEMVFSAKTFMKFI
jgi:hypothetical protein